MVEQELNEITHHIQVNQLILIRPTYINEIDNIPEYMQGQNLI